MSIETTDSTWYVAIQKFGNHFYAFVGAGGQSYRGYKDIANKHCINVVAEEFGVDDTTINRLEGFDENDRRVEGDPPLKVLTDRLNCERGLNPQAELSDLCRVS